MTMKRDILAIRLGVLFGAFVASLLVLHIIAAGYVTFEQWSAPWWRSNQAMFSEENPAEGAYAPDFVLHDLDGKLFRLADVTGKRPVVIEFGSATCQICTMGQSDGQKAELVRKYGDRVDFVFIYGKEAHPNRDDISTSYDRAVCAMDFRESYPNGWRVLVDEDGDQSVTRQYGDRTTFQVVVDLEGRILRKQQDPSSHGLEAALLRLLAET